MNRIRISFIILLSFVSSLAIAQTGTAITTVPYNITEDGDYYLPETINSAGGTNWLIHVGAGVTATLDLNGKDIISTKAGFPVIKNDGTLTIINSPGTLARINGNNKSPKRGIYNTGTLNIYGGRIVNCSGEEGGGIMNDGGVLTIDSAEGIVIRNCSAFAKNYRGGGAVRNANAGTFYLKNGTISECRTTYEKQDGDDPNLIKNNGGGVSNDMGCFFEMSGGTIQLCTSKNDGGGVWNNGTMNVTGGKITECGTERFGGGIFNSRTLNILKGIVEKNTANKGAGIFAKNAEGEPTSFDDPQNFNIVTVDPVNQEDVLIDGNKTTEDWGGGIYIQNGTLNFKNGVVTNNLSLHFGGGIGLSAAKGIISAGLISNNEAYKCGGGIHSGTSSNTTLGDEGGDCSKLIIENNKVTHSLSDEINGGGGLSIGKAGSSNILNLYACTIRNNYSNTYGGGINCRAVDHPEDNNIVIRAGLIQNNTAELNGGGLYINGQVTINGGTLEQNTAKEDGGGIYMSGANIFGMSAGIIDRNTANNNGGGVWVGDNQAKVTISGGTFSNNEAKNNGGGFFASGTIQISNGEISGNEATVNGGGFYVGGGRTTIDDGTIISGNSADLGGGAYLNGTSVLKGAGTRITDNSAREGGALYAMTPDGKETTVSAGIIQHNTSTARGGAIYAKGGTLNIEGSTMSLNSAGSNGGCIFSEGASIMMTNGEISFNRTDTNGAGIFNASSDIILNGGLISSNVAKNNGGGVYSKGGKITLQKSDGSNSIVTISNNEAKNGGGVYLTQTAKMVFNDGLIVENKAVSSGVPIKTAYKSDEGLAGGEINGIGGGVYLGKGTDGSTVKLTFDIQNVGVYQNEADNGADDLFADGLNTSINIPDVADLNLTEYAGRSDGWYADHLNGDTKYNQGLFNTGEGVRYRTDPDTALKYTGDQSAKTCYVCMTLGIKFTKFVIKKSGLKKGESVVFNMTNPGASASRRIVLTGTSDDGEEVSATFGKIEAGTWTVREEGWSWTYEPDTPKEIEIGKFDVELSFDNAKKANVPSNDEAIKENIISSDTAEDVGTVNIVSDPNKKSKNLFW